MGLLPVGERGSRLRWMAFALLSVWLGHQALVNFGVHSSIEENMNSLKPELLVVGEAQYRQHLAEALAVHRVRPEQISVVLDQPTNTWVVTVTHPWTLSLRWWRFEVMGTHQTRMARSSIES